MRAWLELRFWESISIAAWAPQLLACQASRGGDYPACRSFFDQILAYAVPFDIIGLSYYPWWHDNLKALANNLNALATHYGKDILLVKTAYPWTLGWSECERKD